MTISRRVVHRVERDFGDRAKEALSTLVLAEAGNQDCERIYAAIVLITAGRTQRLWEAVQLSRQDWRDVLVFGGLADDDWPEVLEREFPEPDKRHRPKIVSERVAARVRKDFRPKEVEEALRELATTYTSGQGWNRMQAAVVLKAGGDL
ncbi:hypothetical protein ACIA8G_37585 [Lentzea sp. NPDC051213]|uniref:hypothetical protein n=1 Tax=Lentzea sp. NPDC051213 TaxID=3364126 RepID=UPI0037A23E9D